MRCSIVIFLLCFLALSAEAEQNNHFEQCEQLFAVVLSDPNLSRATLEQLKALRPEAGQQKIILDTSRFFSEPLMRQIYEALPPQAHIKLGGNLSSAERYKDDKLTEAQKKPFRDYIDWITHSLNSALGPEEQIELEVAELRVVQKDTSMRGDVHFPWHTDWKSYVTATVDLVGEGTYYTEDDGVPTRDKSKITPRGQTILFSGDERKRQIPTVRPLLHSSPTTPQDRLVLFLQFKRKN